MLSPSIKMRLFWLTILALIGMIAFIIIKASGLDTPGSIYERIASAGLGLDFGMLIVLAMYLSGLLGKIKAKRAMRCKNRILLRRILRLRRVAKRQILFRRSAIHAERFFAL